MSDDRPYPQVPRDGGIHREDVDVDTGQTVRAPKPPLKSDAGPHPPKMVQLLYNRAKGLYRLRAWRVEDVPAQVDDYEEMSRFRPDDTFTTVLEELPDKPRFVVFENTDTGEVYYGRENNLSDNWMQGGRFDQVTVFDDATIAAAYADERQAAMQEPPASEDDAPTEE
jgi:hypothetical protein